MLKQKTYYRNHKRSGILKIVREHYLREDIWCGSQVCGVCKAKNSEKVLDAEPKSKSDAVKFDHYIFLDTNAVLDQIDALEDPHLTNIVILMTVLEEVKHRSSAAYKRLHAIVTDSSRKCYVFVNEHRHETYVERNVGESSNDRNDRAIRVAALWYQNHLPTIKSVLLTDDGENRRKAVEMGLTAMSFADYAEGTDSPTLCERLCSKRWSQLKDEDQTQVFKPHLAPSAVQAGLKAGKLFKGPFYASRDNCLEATVKLDDRDVLLQGKASLNRAIDGDTVVIEILPESEWKAPSNLVVLSEDADEVVEDNSAAKQATGRVVAIVNRKHLQFCGILQVSPIAGHTRHLFVPSKRHIPKIRIETRQSERLANQRIVVAIDGWPVGSRYPQGHFVRALGKIGDQDTENEVLLLEHDIPCYKFSEAVLADLPSNDWVISDEELAKRVDLRNTIICSVDPPGCTDIDDALHCFELPNGNYEAGVHIADVSHFIRPGTAIDKEAAHRATTVYLTDQRIDMIPDLLSSKLCSLQGGEERLAFSCVWEITPGAEIVSTKYHKSVIKSAAAMTYAQAQEKINDANDRSPLAESLRSLNRLAKILKQKRIDNGALSLASPEIRFRIDPITHKPLEVVAKQMLETNSMVEEFMLLANVSVAEKILEEFPECALLRRHPEPPPTNFEPLIKAAEHQGFQIDCSSGKALSLSLDNAVKPADPYFNTMLRILTTRCMQQALYFSTGMLQKLLYFHYGLAMPTYTHFTSPIRRYSDVIVHRQLAACIGADSTYPELLDKRKIEELCNNLNYRKRMAQYASRASVALHTHLFFRDKTELEEGYILFVKKNALQILIPKFGLEGTVILTSKDKKKPSPFVYNSDDHTQSAGDIVFHAFDRVVVQMSLDRSNIQHEKLQMKLVEPEVPGFSVTTEGELLPAIEDTFG
ncbi:RNB [Nesidiocoris tenuis]|uniref:RNB n=1 Tax=Nesidiocoris tenuis TaxID=355587 RepID=A0ABN7BDG5_9HEMI|nr:RNB [Nesidiocoris tenuis]